MSRCLWCQGTVDMPMTFSQLFFEKPSEKRLCRLCNGLLAAVADSALKCARCCKISDKAQCEDCQNWQERYPDYPFMHKSLFYYNAFARDYMEKYKIMGDCELSLLFADELKGYFRPVLEHSVLVPIPITEQSQAARGFNQVELLLESAGLPYVKALNNVGEGEKQARKNRRERLRMTQPFTLEYPAVSRLEGASVILVDDLYTTGRTLFHAADALKSALPGRIQTFSLFR